MRREIDHGIASAAPDAIASEQHSNGFVNRRSPVQSREPALDSGNSKVEATAGRSTPREFRARLAFGAALVLALLGLAAGCTSSGKATETLSASGYTEIKTTGWDPFTCSKDDSTCTGFEAKGPTGARVYGAVGCGYFFRGCTVRVTGSSK